MSGKGTGDRFPGGTVTFLFTDIEGSTELLGQLDDRYAQILAEHRQILRDVFQRKSGREVDSQGDAFFYSFPRATDAVTAAVAAQQALMKHSWPADVEVRVRMGLHTGEPMVSDEGYVGMDVHRAARIAHVGHGGQVLLSETTTALVRGAMPDGVSLMDLGRHRLKDLRHPERISQLVVEGMPSVFPPLRSIEALPPEAPDGLGRAQLPAFLKVDEAEFRPRGVFVGRERELERLNGFLELAVGGKGGIAFLSGGAGCGKTALLGKFARSAMDQHPELLVACGSCSAFTGAGDPYLPFRDVTSMLAGDLESSVRSGLIRISHAGRIWEALPITLKALLNGASDLIDVLVSGRDLHSRVSMAIEGGSIWHERVAALAARTGAPGAQNGQAAIFDAFLHLLDGISSEAPLILLLDDLQWVDEASVDLLFHIGRSLSGRRVLIVGAYRPEGVNISGDGGQSAFGKTLSEFKRLYGDIGIDLGELSEMERRQFVQGLLEQELKTFTVEFRDSLFRQTAGHALFTVELLQQVRDRGQLVRDDKGRWDLSEDGDWGALPARVEGAIETRLGDLNPDLRSLLTTASVDGEEFAVETLTRVLGSDAGRVLDKLQVLEDQGLVKELGPREIAGRQLFRYQFRHHLFHTRLYDCLSAARRAHLHALFAVEIEGMFSGDLADVAVQLAWHYAQAGMPRQAIPYMIQAGERAARMSAPKEATKHYQEGLELISALPQGEARDQQELELVVGLLISLITLKGYGHPEVGSVLRRAMELGEAIGDLPRLFIPGIGYAAFLGAIARYEQGQEAWAHLMAMAERMDDPLFMALSHWPGWISLMQGDFPSALRHMQHIIKFYDPRQHAELRHTFGVDPGAISRLWAAWALWFLGHPDQGERMVQEAFELARSLEHPHTMAFVTGLGCLVHWLRGDLIRMREWGEVAIQVSDEHGIQKFYGDGLINLGAAQVAEGQTEAGIAQMREGISVVERTGTRLGHSINMIRLGEALMRAQEWEEADQALSQAVDFIRETGEEIMVAEAQRLRGELGLARGADWTEVKGIYSSALEIAQEQDARSLKLRVLIDLCQFSGADGGQGQAMEMLRGCYLGFSEGDATRDLLTARDLLRRRQGKAEGGSKGQ